jgi:hypothetical protein
MPQNDLRSIIDKAEVKSAGGTSRLFDHYVSQSAHVALAKTGSVFQLGPSGATGQDARVS